MWHLDEVFVKIGGERQYLWRAVDQDGDVIDILVQRYRSARAAKRFFRKLLKGQGSTPWRLVTDKLRFKSAGSAQRFPSVQGVIQNLFNLGRHQLSSATYRLLRERSVKEWNAATAA